MPDSLSDNWVWRITATSWPPDHSKPPFFLAEIRDFENLLVYFRLFILSKQANFSLSINRNRNKKIKNPNPIASDYWLTWLAESEEKTLYFDEDRYDTEIVAAWKEVGGRTRPFPDVDDEALMDEADDPHTH